MEIKEMTLEQVVKRMSEIADLGNDSEKRSALSIQDLDALIDEQESLKIRKLELEKLQDETRKLNLEEVQMRQKKLLEIANNNNLPIFERKEEIKNMEFEKSTVADTKEYRSAWLKKLQGTPLNEVEQRAYSTAATTGAEIIPTEVADAIIQKVYQYAPVLKGLKLLRIPGNNTFSLVDNEDESAIHTENAAITGASDTLKSITLSGYEIVKLVSASKAVSVMALAAFEAFIVDSLGKNLARRIEKFVFLGTGSSQPTGLVKAGAGTDGAYTDGTDQISIANATAVTEADVLSWYGMVDSHPDTKAFMSKATFLAYFYPLMNVGKNVSVRFVNGVFYILDLPVEFTNTLSKGIAYLASLENVLANMAKDITVEKSVESGFTRNAVDYKADCLFDCKPITGRKAFAKFVKAQS